MGLSRIALAGCGLFFLAATSGCGSDEWPATEEVHIGVKVDQPGTGYRNGTYGAYTGFDIRIAYMAAGALGKEPKFFAVPSDERQTAVGRDNLVVATFSIIDDRLIGKSAVDFVGPYAMTHSGILVRKADRPGIRDVSDLKDKRVCTWPGTTSGVTASRAIPKYLTAEGSDAGDCVRKLTKKQGVDAVFTDTLLLQGFAQEDKSLEVVKPKSGTFQYYGIALPKGHRDGCEKIKEELKRYMNSGKWDIDFASIFHSINKKGDYKPTTEQVDKYSCQDKVGRG
ncbi:transporter substrate-binding domain-containing protein [Streptomyces atratus]|uniref:Glutamate transport system substrate-binding protein n=1 Tax=Streptomyces atratus TaxID=1893 RepID=A0A1K2ENE9_STRAR|nr:transporter substrate-binding domain-containing protein [Streptomyces atratus]SFY36574.1 glutamate transport system substrate-binding protein [Streptomyces atratus]